MSPVYFLRNLFLSSEVVERLRGKNTHTISEIRQDENTPPFKATEMSVWNKIYWLFSGFLQLKQLRYIRMKIQWQAKVKENLNNQVDGEGVWVVSMMTED